VIYRGKSLAPLQAVGSKVWLSYLQRSIYRYLLFASIIHYIPGCW